MSLSCWPADPVEILGALPPYTASLAEDAHDDHKGLSAGAVLDGRAGRRTAGDELGRGGARSCGRRAPAQTETLGGRRCRCRSAAARRSRHQGGPRRPARTPAPPKTAQLPTPAPGR